MKRIILSILFLLLSLCLISCNKENNNNDGNQEIQEKYQVKDLRSLFGRDIPQAAIFVSNNANSSDISAIVDLIKKNINELNANPSEFAKVAVTRHKIFESWGEELIAKLLPNAGIKYELNKEDVSEVLNLLEVKNFKDTYYELEPVDKATPTNAFSVVVPSGLPFLAVSNLIGVDKVTVNNVTGDQIPTALTKGEADIVIAPINAGCKLIGAGKANYKLLSPITFNNAFIVSSIESKKIEKVSDLDGLTIHAFNEAGIPSAVLKYLFTSNSLNMDNVDFTQASSAAILAAYNNAELKNEYILISEPELSKLLNEET